MVQEGSTLFEVQNVLGLSTPTMPQRYAHLQPDHLWRAVKALDRELSSPKTCNTSPKASEVLAICRGRDAGRPAPPTQIRTRGITASGSHLWMATPRRTSG
jgi:hypothetical protein